MPALFDSSTLLTFGVIAASAALAACAGDDPTGPAATITFVLDAPLCSSVLPVQFSIDGTVVRTDTFRVNVSNPHLSSARFTTTAGTHTLGARVINGYLWADTVVTVTAGTAFTKALPFYCS